MIFNSQVEAAKPADDSCTTIQDGGLTDVKGDPITLGYDQWGYNYEAHMFNGWYDNYSRPQDMVSSGDRLMMKWNDAWLSNKSCDGNDKLDRPTEVKGSGAWLTNHASGTYEDDTYNVTADYVVEFEYQGGYWNHDLMLTEDSTGALTGSGGYPSGS